MDARTLLGADISARERAVYGDLAQAEDSGNLHRIVTVGLAVQDWLEGAGCIHPEAALLASLLLNPDAVGAVTALVQSPGAFVEKRDQALYAAILGTPYAGDRAAWYADLVRFPGVTWATIAGYLVTEFYNCAQVLLYAQMVFAAAVRRTLLVTASRLAVESGDKPIQAIDAALRTLTAVRARLLDADGMVAR
jgi:replicative DNA helicase